MRHALRTTIVTLVTVGLLALFFRQADFGRVLDEIRNVDARLLLLSLVFTVITYVVRAYRWQRLLSPIGTTRFRVAFRTTVIGFAASFLLPARAGEVIRPFLLARQERLSATAAFGTVVLERLFDVVAVLICFVAFLFWYTPGPEIDLAVFSAVKMGGLLAAAAAAGAFLVGFAVAGRPEVVGRITGTLGRVLPSRLADLAAAALAKFVDGFAVLRDGRALVVILVLSLPLWLAIAGSIWSVTRAFHLDMPVFGAFLVMTILVVGVAVPTPGAVGGFHEAYRLSMVTFFHAPNDVAIGAALVLHAISFLPVTLVGVWFMAQEGWNLGSMRELAEEGRRAEHGEAGMAAPPVGSTGEGRP